MDESAVVAALEFDGAVDCWDIRGVDPAHGHVEAADVVMMSECARHAEAMTRMGGLNLGVGQVERDRC